MKLSSLSISLLTVVAACVTNDQPSPPKRPNVIVIMTDDQGLGDLGCLGNPVLDTPNIDRLAAGSARLANFYVSPVCTPTRASLMTGRHAYRTRAIDTWIGRAMMEPDEVTMAEELRDSQRKMAEHFESLLSQVMHGKVSAPGRAEKEAELARRGDEPPLFRNIPSAM